MNNNYICKREGIKKWLKRNNITPIGVMRDEHYNPVGYLYDKTPELEKQVGLYWDYIRRKTHKGLVRNEDKQ